MWDSEQRELVVQARKELPYGMRAFESLAAGQYSSIRYLALSMLGDRDAADTITQDVLMRVMHGLPKLEDVDRFPAWLARITTNVTRSHLAKERREREKYYAFSEEQVWDSPDPEQSDADFGVMLAGLSVLERSIVSLKILQDLEFNQIAEVVGLGISATKMRYYRALEKVRLRIEPDEAQE
ncbi:MAG: sigma-70 family RNA polymerase sigma factor [Pseudomonadales bacterium]